MLLIWDDGAQTDAYIVDNRESSSRFRFTGTARLVSGWSAGFVMEMEFDGARSSSASQVSDGDPTENIDSDLEGRKVALYLQSENVGRVWLGRYSPATDDLLTYGNKVAKNPIANATPSHGEGLFLRARQGTGGCAGAGCLINQTWSRFMDGQDAHEFTTFASPIAGVAI